MELTDSTLVLVGITPKPKDLEIARLLGWYRIPLKTAPKILNVDTIAFYQTASFPEGEKSRIVSFADVRGVELTTRKSLLRDEPNHPRADEEYYKLQLGPLQTLRVPILSDRWKRFVFFYTTGEKLSNAKTLSDLSMSSSERGSLWKSLRERQETPLLANSDETESIPQEILFLLGNLSLSPLDFENKEQEKNT